MIKSIPLASLVVSERNVRRSSDPAADAQLAADIAAHGLLQNLVVTPQKAPNGTYAVEAGGRRLRALQSLQREGVLPDVHKVACLVIGARGDASAASEASLAENLQRLAMNPADECLAFGRLIEQGADVDGIARRFGLTLRHVEGRLRLAGLHPVVFEALGADAITLDAAKAYAATSDQERQLWVFEQLGSAWGGAHPDSIRRMMINATVPASDRRLRFVGEEAYLTAGGRIERDLFAAADEARVLDVEILETLATDKLEVEAAWLANEHGYAFVRASLDSYVQAWRHEDICHADIVLPEPGEEDRQQIEALEAEIDTLAELLEDEHAEDDARAETETSIAEREARLSAIASRPPVLDPETRGAVGFFLLLDEAGVPRLDRTPYALIGEGAGNQSDGVGDETPGGSMDDAGGDARQSGDGGSSDSSNSKSAAKPKLPQRLVDELAMQRRDILALHLARDPGVAFDLAVFLMIKDEGGYCYDNAGSSLTARPPHDPVLRGALPNAPVQALLVAVSDQLDRRWTGHETLTAKFDAFRALSHAARLAWLGAAIARSLEASTNGNGRSCTFHDHLATLLGIEVAEHWRPTALNWFDRVSKAQCLAALSEVGASELATRHAKAKKGEIAEACEKLFAGEGIVEAEVKAAALAWVPEPMRFVTENPVDRAVPWDEDDTPGVEQIDAVAFATGEDELGAEAEDDAEHSCDRESEPGTRDEAREAGKAAAGEEPGALADEAVVEDAPPEAPELDQAA